MVVTPENPAPDRPQVLALDSLWFDPELLNVACPIAMQDVAIVAGKPQRIIGADPTRWLIGFAVNSSSTLPQLGPWPDANLFSVNSSAGGLPIMIWTLQTLGPFVSNAWYANSPGPLTVRVIWCNRFNGG